MFPVCFVYVLFITVTSLSLYPMRVVGFEYFESQCNALLLLGESKSQLEIEPGEVKEEETIITADLS